MRTSAISERTVVGVLFRQCERYGERPFIHHHDGTGWVAMSWAEVGRRVQRVAAGLVGAGVEPGERVVLMSHNRLEWLIADWAIQAAGAVTVPIYPSTSRSGCESIVENAEARLAMVENDQLGSLLPVARRVGIGSEMWAWSEREPDPAQAAEVERRLAALTPDDLVTFVYTSGTTGEPKGVELAQRCIVDTTRAALRAFPVGETDHLLSFLPYAHVLERLNSITVAMAAGATIHISRGMDRILEDIGEVRPTVMVSVPRLYEKMHAGVLEKLQKEPGWRRALFAWAIRQGRTRAETGRAGPLYGIAHGQVLAPIARVLTGGRLRFFVSGGAALGREVEAFFWAIGVPICNGWGLTETSSGAVSNTLDHHRYGTVGVPMPGIEVRIAEDGEIMVLSPGNMLGYHRRPDATAATLIDGWIATGDIGRLDADGFLRITDRKKDLFKTAGGKYIAPQPLESTLEQDPGIERVVVVGDERPYVTALVVPAWSTLQHRLGTSAEPAQLATDPRVAGYIQERVDRLNGGLGSWETIKYFHVLPEDFSEARGELTPTLKVKRRVVADHYREAIDEMYRRARPAGRT